MKENTIKLNIELCPQVLRSLKNKAIKMGVSLSEIINDMLISHYRCGTPSSNISTVKKDGFNLFIGCGTPERQEISISKASEIYGVSTKTIKRRIQANKLRPSRVSPQGKNCKKFYYLSDIETLFSSERQ